MNKEVIDEFFNYAKDDELVVFIDKYYAFECSDKVAFSKRLSKLFKKYLSKKVKDLKETTDKEAIINDLTRINDTIMFLKEEQIKLLEKKVEPKIKEKVKKSNIQIKTKSGITKKERIKKKNNKEEKNKIIKKIIKAPKIKEEKIEKKVDVEIIEFFEYEKHDNIYEFQINFENWNYEDKDEAKKELLKLFKKYLNQSLNDKLSSETYEESKQAKDMCKRIKKIIAYLRVEKLDEIKKDLPKIKKKKEKKEKIYYYEEIEEQALEDLSKYYYSKALNIFLDNLKNKKADEYLIKQAKYIAYQTIEQDITDQDTINNLFMIKSIINDRIIKIPKENKGRKKLKEIRNLFDIVVCKFKSETNKYDPLCEIIEYFINNENYYLYLKKIVKNFPEIINIRYYNEHILIHILDTFIENYTKLIKNKESEYINKDYLKSIYLLFLNNPYLSISKEELDILDNKLNNFKKEVNNEITSSKRKQAVINDIEDMYTNNMYDKIYNSYDENNNYMSKRKAIKYVNEFNLENQMNAIYSNMVAICKSGKRENLIKEHIIMLNDNYYAYSIINQKGKKILKIHVLDLSSAIVKDSDLENYIYNQTITGNEIDPFIISMITMKKGKIYPTITYEFEITNESKKLKRIYLSKIKIKKKCTKVDPSLKSYVELTNKINLNDIDNDLKSVFNEKISEYLEDNNLPIAYSGIKQTDENEINVVLNDLSYLLSKLKKEDFMTIYRSIDSEIDEFHYDTKKIDNSDLDLLNPSNYVGILLEHIVREIIIEKKNSEEEKQRLIEKYKKQIDDLIAVMNYHTNYVNKDILKENKGRLVKRRRMY